MSVQRVNLLPSICSDAAAAEDGQEDNKELIKALNCSADKLRYLERCEYLLAIISCELNRMCQIRVFQPDGCRQDSEEARQALIHPDQRQSELAESRLPPDADDALDRLFLL